VIVIAPEPPAPPVPGAPAKEPRWIVRQRPHAGRAEVATPPDAEDAAEERKQAEEQAAEDAREAAEDEAERKADAEEREREAIEEAVDAQREALDRQMEALGREIGRQAEEMGRQWSLPGVGLSEEQRKKIQADAQRAAREAVKAAKVSREVQKKQLELLGRGFDHLVRRGGAAVGTVRAQVRSEQVLASVLARTPRHRGELPFALDAKGKLYTGSPEEQKQLEALALRPAAEGDSRTRSVGDWIVVTRRDPGSGLTLGMAQPVGESLKEIRRTAARNLAYGFGIVGLALLGILPLSRRMTRNLASLSDGAERLAQGDLEARVPVRSADEFGRLAETFNRMAQQLRTHQDQLLERERLRKELEMSRRIQEELLPRGPLRISFAEAKGISIPAREVGGDFFNYFPLASGEAALLVGDVSGKGLPAALLMANLQATLRARLPLEPDLAALATHLDQELSENTPESSYLTLFMGVLDGRAGLLRYVSAGHNTQFALRASGDVIPLESTGRPLGLLAGGGYEERRVALAEGDGLFLFTDGLVDAENEQGEAFGTERLEALLRVERSSGLDGTLAHVEQAVRAHRGRAEPLDDATMLVLKLGPADAA
jgi:serine phosphatase RsbU (regulator of sigma subunit)